MHCLFGAVLLVIFGQTDNAPGASDEPGLKGLQIRVARGKVTRDDALMRSCIDEFDAWRVAHPEDEITAIANAGFVYEHLGDKNGCVARMVSLCRLPLNNLAAVRLRRTFVQRAIDRLQSTGRTDWVQDFIQKALESPPLYGDETLRILLLNGGLANQAYSDRVLLIQAIMDHIRPGIIDSTLSPEFVVYLKEQFRELEWIAIQIHHDAAELGPLWQSIRDYLDKYGAEDSHAIEAMTKGLNATCHLRKAHLPFPPQLLPGAEWIAHWRAELAAQPVSAINRHQEKLEAKWSEWDQLMTQQHKLGWLTNQDLRNDLRLQNRISCNFQNPTIGELLEWVNSGSPIRLEIADKASLSRKASGRFVREGTTVSTAMEYFCTSEQLKGRWFAEPERIVLHLEPLDARSLELRNQSFASWQRWVLLGANFVIITAIVFWTRRNQKHKVNGGAKA